jgi:carbonic anhydrase/acetyltransferase-like protein (isoleucine patch superfamily)
MLVRRNGKAPRVDATASIADSARIVGDVTVGARCYIDHHVVIESSGPAVEIGAEVIVFAGSVVRSVGGHARPSFAVTIGERTLVSPHCTLTGCRIGRMCYLATAAIVLQGAVLGYGTLIGAGAMVHAGTILPEGTRVGMRYIAVPAGDGFLSTADVERARETLGPTSFFDAAFGIRDTDQVSRHEQLMTQLLEEVSRWRDEPVVRPEAP